MSPLRAGNRKKVALLVSDIHLSHRPPISRSTEKNWYECQAGYLAQLKRLAGDLPILCGGDYFDKWNSPPELINLAIEYAPVMFCVPGQHDLPYHSLSDIRKSAYWTMVEAGKIANIRPDKPLELARPYPMRLHGFSWGKPVQPLEEPHDLVLEIAICHEFIWSKNTGYPGASRTQRIKPFIERLKGFDVALFGDNHKTTIWNLMKQKDGITIFNPGSFMRRTIDQKDHHPCVGYLYNDGTVQMEYLDVTKDQMVDERRIKDGLSDPRLIEFLGGLLFSSDLSISFREVLTRALDEKQVDDIIRKMVLQALEEAER